MYLITEHFELIEFYAGLLKLPEELQHEARSSAEKAAILVQNGSHTEANSLIASSLGHPEFEHQLNIGLMKDLIWFTVNLQTLKRNSLFELRPAIAARFADLLSYNYFVPIQVGKEIALHCVHTKHCDREFQSTLWKLIGVNVRTILLRNATFGLSLYLAYMSADALPKMFNQQ